MEEKTKSSPMKRKAIDAVNKREGKKLEPIPIRRILHSTEEKKSDPIPMMRILHSSIKRSVKRKAMVAVANIFEDRHEDIIRQPSGK